MDYGIISRIDLPEAQLLTERIIRYMNEYTDICVEENTAERSEVENSIDALPLEEMNVDTLITVGGDGTILRALQKIDAEIFAVNMGRVGFLTEVNGDHIEDHLERLLRKDYFVEQRPKLRTIIEDRVQLDAVNEAVIHTAQISKIRHYNIFVGVPQGDQCPCKCRSLRLNQPSYIAQLLASLSSSIACAYCLSSGQNVSTSWNAFCCKKSSRIILAPSKVICSLGGNASGPTN